jgi:butyryl-CoA dehydrogenase
LAGEIRATLADAARHPTLAEFVTQLGDTLDTLLASTEAVIALRTAGEEGRAMANAGVYLDFFGHIVVAWLWLRQACVAQSSLAATPADDFYQGKLKACQYFFRYELARVPERLRLIAAGDDTCLSMSNEWF